MESNVAIGRNRSIYRLMINLRRIECVGSQRICWLQIAGEICCHVAAEWLIDGAQCRSGVKQIIIETRNVAYPF